MKNFTMYTLTWKWMFPAMKSETILFDLAFENLLEN